MTHSELLKVRQAKGKRLKNQRIKTGTTKAELMRRSGLSRTTINSIESGKLNFSIDTQALYLNGLKKQTS
jgi:DNA-binding XRE family transcriptional regulator